MPKKIKSKQARPKEVVEPPRRKFYVDNKLEFDFYFKREESMNPEDIMNEFLKDKDWVWFENYFEVKYKSYEMSEDTKEVHIKVRPMNKKELKKARSS